MDLKLFRFGSLPGVGTFGQLHAGATRIYTVEKPWLPSTDGLPGGQPFESCVPVGRYDLVPFDSPKHPDCWALENELLGVSVANQRPTVPRYACLIHKANWPKDVQGCIGPGLSLQHIYGELGVGSSGDAMDGLRLLLADDEPHTLTIEWMDYTGDH